jgi:hypothetical protein
MNLLPLLWQLPAIFTAVPLVHRLLPFKLAARAIPLFYTIVSLVVMAVPDRLSLALAAAGLVSLAHNRLGILLAKDPPPDMKLVRETVSNWSALAWDYIVTHLPVSGFAPGSVSRASRDQDPTVHDDSEDDKSEDDSYQEPPKAPPDKIPQRIAHL